MIMGITRLRLAVMVAVSLAVLTAGGGSASAAVPSAGWAIDSFATPTNFSAGESKDVYTVMARNAGSVSTDGSQITLSDVLPGGVSAGQVSLTVVGGVFGKLGVRFGGELCSTEQVRCEYPGPFGGFLPPIEPGVTLKMTVSVTVDPGASGSLRNEASISGGGGGQASVRSTNAISSTQPSFGLSDFSSFIGGLDGRSDTQAGDHPQELTTIVGLNNAFRTIGPEQDGSVAATSVQDLKDAVVDLPVGFVGSTLAAPQCNLTQLSRRACPADTVVGHLETEPEQNTSVHSSLYNLVPERGVPAEFGYYDVLGLPHLFYVRVVPTVEGYLLQAFFPEIPAIDLAHIIVTVYGDPAAKQEELAAQEHKVVSPLPHVPFFTNPTSCPTDPLTGEPVPVTTRIYIDSWQNPGTYNPDGTPDLTDKKWVSATSTSPGMIGCDALRFPAEIRSQPTTHESDKPSGLDLEIKLPQSETMGVPATPTMKKAVVTFPVGFTVDPSAGDGLAACSEAQIGWVGPGHLDFNGVAPGCPEASKVGTLELETPLIPHKFEGVMYLATQNENPFASTIGLYVVVDDPFTGVLVKIPGKATMDPHTGQLTGEFDENPNVPFSDLKLHFFGGPRAEFATPESCGTFATTTSLTPYSAPGSGPPAVSSDSFLIDELCPAGFDPSFAALSTNLQAGAYTPFVVSFSRSDTDQELQGLTVTLPPGLLANLTGIPLCSDADATAAMCPASTQVGTVLTSVGPGPNPLQVAGKAYLTGAYNGGPYGLAVVVPAVAGPFNFGTVVVRQSIRIDPITAQVTDVSDPFPTIIDGIPLRLRRVDVSLGRPGGFTFNPTNCSKLGFAGRILGTPLGAPTTLNGTIGYAILPGETSSFTGSSVPFQVTNCGSLGFKPVFNVSTQGKTSRANGASLSVRLSYPNAAFGTQANIKSVKVDLPKQLPSRLTTLQKACPDSTFERNPAACPPGSRVGTATATTPVLETVLSGPAYFVSHGGAKFPELVIVLAGQGITVELHGETFISKAGITSSTFHTVPDVPIGVFTLNLPEGANSALAANGNLCKGALKMPTAFTAQNGMSVHQSTPITATGCAKKVHKKTKGRAKKAGGRHKGNARGKK
jgi:uncharacterized repeat protein (TIGR01451 family)